MRILFLTSRLPYPPNRGDRLRAYHFLQRLSASHHVTLVSFIAHADERRYLPPLRDICQEVLVVEQSRVRSATTVLLNLFRPEPMQALYYRSSSMRRLLDDLLATRSFQAAYIHLFRMAPYLIGRSDLYRIVDLTDVISKEVERSLPFRGLASRVIYSLEHPRIERYERIVARRLDESWLISEADRETLLARCPAANIRVVPNGVDLNMFRPIETTMRPRGLLFVGHLSVPHNIDAAVFLAREILPRVEQNVPECTLEIVGAEPVEAVRALAAEARVRVPGFVPDLNLALNQAQVFVAPLRFAAGVQNKVLEAMAAGRPVVTTTIVNSGLGAVAGRDLLVADDADALAAHVASLLRDQDRAREIGQAGRAFVQAQFSWERVAERMAEIEEQIARQGH